MNHYVVSFTWDQCVAEYGDTEIDVVGQWESADAARDAVIAKCGDGVGGMIAPECPIWVTNSNTNDAVKYLMNDDYLWVIS